MHSLKSKLGNNNMLATGKKYQRFYSESFSNKEKIKIKIFGKGPLSKTISLVEIKPTTNHQVGAICDSKRSTFLYEVSKQKLINC